LVTLDKYSKESIDMTIQTIKVGGYANDGTGDDLRTAFEKVNANFALLGSGAIIDGTNLGLGAGVFAQKNQQDATLEFKTLISSDNTIEFDATDPEVIDVKSKALLINDPGPTLSADLNINNHKIINTGGGSGLETNIFGIDFRVTNTLLELLLASNSVALDFGSFIPGTSGTPDALNTTYDLDMNGLLINGFIGTPPANHLDFGKIV
jgi:hypothetical protein